jgi:hypothetical protein
LHNLPTLSTTASHIATTTLVYRLLAPCTAN